MRVDGSPWISLGLFREQGRPPFDAADTELVAGLSRPLAEAAREHARPVEAAAGGGEGRGPGLMLFAPPGELMSVNDDALAWLDELPPDAIDAESFDVRLPMVVAATLVRARAIAHDRDHQTARARLRAVTGRWLVCHASCLRDSGGDVGATALVIEPARGSEMVPLMVQAYELTRRERDITQLIAKGLGTAEIAERLVLSTHTVRDCIKRIFEKVGVSTRGELVARIFTEQYAPMHLHPGNHDVGEGASAPR